MITEAQSPYRAVTDEQLAALMRRETDRFMSRTNASAALSARARETLYNGVPMPWMDDWGLAHPVFFKEARGNRITDVDGNEYLDFCLGDTGAMFGHGNEVTARAVQEQALRGITTMLPTEDALTVGRELSRRFGLPLWQTAMTATEANRYSIRICRALTRRPKILVMNECYHGSLDETLPHRCEDGTLGLRTEYDMNPAIEKDRLTRVVEFNDIDALERELAHRDCAAVLAEPVMTNCGMVLPAEGYHQRLRELCTKYGTYLIIDETHTFSTGPGGYTAAYGLQPDILTCGKAIAGGVPFSVYGFTHEIARRMDDTFGRSHVSDPMGIGGTLSGNAFSLHAAAMHLQYTATDEAFEHMIRLQNRMSDGLEAVTARHGLEWSVTRCGARAELQFMPFSPRNGSEAKRHFDWKLMYFLHLHLSNRGILITPFHNMMLVPPVATEADIDQLVNGWDAALGALKGAADGTV
jgi:glutamate-1-semialdehyde 2,1-aminomutase